MTTPTTRADVLAELATASVQTLEDLQTSYRMDMDRLADEIVRLRAIATEHATMRKRPVLAVQVVCKGNVCVYGHWDIDNVTPGMRADWLRQGMKIIELVAQEPT